MSPEERRQRDPRADALRAEYARRFGDPGVPVPVDDIAVDLLGLRVRLVDDLGCSGALFPALRLVALDAEEARESEGRRRFTLAHEVAHWVLHYRDDTAAAPHYARDLTPGSVDPKEREANVFAADLLMPYEAVIATSTQSADVLADRFVVSEPAMEWRLFNLGLVDERPGG